MFKTLRAWLARAVLLAVVLALVGCGSGSNPTTVPSQVREAIVKDYPGMALIPGRLPSGYHYKTWIRPRTQKAYVMTFQRGSGKSKAYLELQVQRRACPAPPKWTAKGTLYVNGHALKWLRSDEVGPVVWRCMSNGGHSIAVFALEGPRRRLAELVGYLQPAH